MQSAGVEELVSIYQSLLTEAANNKNNKFFYTMHYYSQKNKKEII